MTASILFLNPPSPHGVCADREAMYGMGIRRKAYARAQPPHTLAWCAAQLHPGEWEVHGLDAVAAGLDEITTIRHIVALSPAVIVALSSYATAGEDAVFFRSLRRRCQESRLLIVSHAAGFLPATLASSADMLLVGEPEGAIHAACSTLLDPDGVRGTTSARSLEVAAYSAQNSLIDISYLAPPQWELFDLRRYDTLPVLSARGCNYGCRYCAAPRTQGKLRVRLAERVAAELQLLVSRHHVREFYFIDPLFGADRAHVTALLRAMERRDLGKEIVWQCETRPECLDVPLLRRMRRAGCRAIHLGVESVSALTLISIGRIDTPSATPEYLGMVRQVILACRAYGIDCHLHLMAGLPGDPAAANATRTFVRAYAGHSGQVRRFAPFPGTSIYPTDRVDDEWLLLQETLPEEADMPGFPVEREALRSLAH